MDDARSINLGLGPISLAILCSIAACSGTTAGAGTSGTGGTTGIITGTGNSGGAASSGGTRSSDGSVNGGSLGLGGMTSALVNPAPGSKLFVGVNFWRIEWEGADDYFQSGVDFSSASNPWTGRTTAAHIHRTCRNIGCNTCRRRCSSRRWLRSSRRAQ